MKFGLTNDKLAAVNNIITYNFSLWIPNKGIVISQFGKRYIKVIMDSVTYFQMLKDFNKSKFLLTINKNNSHNLFMHNTMQL